MVLRLRHLPVLELVLQFLIIPVRKKLGAMKSLALCANLFRGITHCRTMTIYDTHGVMFMEFAAIAIMEYLEGVHNSDEFARGLYSFVVVLLRSLRVKIPGKRGLTMGCAFRNTVRRGNLLFHCLVVGSIQLVF